MVDRKMTIFRDGGKWPLSGPYCVLLTGEKMEY
jgi:hypothetical protein